MNLEARCRTTAMGIMPHTDVERALSLALSLDIPFWPQLPNLSFYEDMYAQTSENFPGIAIDLQAWRLEFDNSRFETELEGYSQRMDDPETFALGKDYSLVFRRFLERDLNSYTAIRGQVTGPVSFGFKLVDENRKPIIYSEGVRTILFDFIQKKVNTQYRQLRAKNENAFVWVDEPGLGWVFSGLTGYNDVQAKSDYQAFLSGLEGPRGLHLCANVNLPYLLELGVDIVSFDAYQIERMPKGYASAVAEFLEGGGIISWGIVPTDSASLGGQSPPSLAEMLQGYWEVVAQGSGLSPQRIAERSLLAPARCCLKNIGQVGAVGEAVAQRSGASCGLTTEEGLVEKAFAYLGELSQILKEHYRL